MKWLNKIAFAIVILVVMPSCASIVSKTRWPLTINTNPSNAKLEITDRKNRIVYSGTTPAIVPLKSGAGFFVPASYHIKLTMDGYEPKDLYVGCSLNGWYIGNVVFGGLVGLLIVDPATGAMYKLNSEYVFENMTKSSGYSNNNSLNIIDINKLPQSMKEHLVLLK